MPLHIATTKTRRFEKFFKRSGVDIRILGLLFIASGWIDLFWILSYPNYALTVFGATFEGWGGTLIKLQHPCIHWIIGYGFWNTQRWSYRLYLWYLGLACMSEITTQLFHGYHPTRTTMIVVSVLFGSYIIARHRVFRALPL
ncbi:MAG: hypothetical protein GKS05_01725 [Nitrospirales bacterium]|nr:hypothetical protein [Nitrospirales bacterium]